MARDVQRWNRERFLVTPILHVEDCRLVRTCAPRLVVRIRLITKLYFDDSHLLKPQFSCDNAWSSPLRSSHSCHYVIFVGWCSQNPWVACIYRCSRYYCSSLTEKVLKSSKDISIRMTTTRIMQCELPCMLQYSSCVYSKTIISEQSPAVHCVLST
jgi:hypothetical protein